jgi:hypothetical protein
MHAFATEIIEEFEPRQLINARELAELDHPLWVMNEIAKLRIWLGVPGRGESRRPSLEVLEVLLARGKASLVALFRAYEAATTAAESLAVLRALGALVRAAKAKAVVDWDIDNIRPDDGRGRLLVSFDPALDEKLRAAAQAEGQTLSDFVRASVSDRIAAIEKRRPRSAAAAPA